ncbi:MAG TPA: hypothetical protein VJ914_19800 [Pseudonocardiaceae bacterium]|nr:hypothetical protein [Pseudonocardiaceae bacterium]
MILSSGRHRDPREGRCLLELVSVLAGERWTDHPRCVHPVLASVARRVNDACSDEGRDALIPLAAPLIGTRGAPVSAVLVARCARAALSVRPDLRRLRRMAGRTSIARSLVADAVTVLAEHAECADQRLVSLLRECVDVTNGTLSLPTICVPHSVYSRQIVDEPEELTSNGADSD